MRKDTTPADMLFDTRVVKRNIGKGIVTQKEYDARLAALPDTADNSELVHTRLGEDDLGGAEQDDDDEG